MSLNLTADEKKQLSAALSVVTPDSGTAALAAPAPRDLFCRSWPIVKPVLQTLRDDAPQPVKDAIALVIAAGDAASGVICR